MKNTTRKVSNIKPLREVERACWAFLAKAKSDKIIEIQEPNVQKMRRVLKTAVKYDLLEVAAISSSYLQHYYYNTHKHQSLGAKFSKISTKYFELATIEKKILLQLQPLRYELNSKLHVTPKLQNKLKAFIEQVLPYLDYNSPTISSHIYLPLIKHYELNEDLEKMESTTENAINLLRPLHRHHFYLYSLSQICLRKQEYQKAREAIHEALMYAKKWSNNYCYYMIGAIQCELYAGNWKTANELHHKTKWAKAEDYKIKEYDYLLRGYLDFLLPSNNFSLGRFFNEINIYKSDKAGMNVNVYIVHFLYYLARNRDRLIDAYESLDSYTRRYTRGRTRHFMRLLLGVIKYKFNKKVIEFRIQKDLSQMKKHPVNPNIEILHFDLIWQRILDHLNKN